MNHLGRRLARLETRQPPEPQCVRVAREWLRDWDQKAPRLARTYDVLREAKENGAALVPLDARLLAHLEDLSVRPGVVAAVRFICEDLTAEVPARSEN